MTVSPAGGAPGAPTAAYESWPAQEPLPSDDAPRGAPDGPQLVVRTVAIDDLPEGRTALVDRLPDGNALTWVRHGDGLAGWGEALRFETFGPGRFADADDKWRQVLDKALVHDDVRLPGSGLVAFGSFAFDDVSPGDEEEDPARASGVLIVPRVVVGRRGEHAWLTTVSLVGDRSAPVGEDLLSAYPHRPVTGPGRVVLADGAVGAADWPGVVAEGIARIQAGELEKVVLARDVVASTEHPVDARHLLGRLAAAYDACWTFSVDGMVGATPELLVRSEKGLVASRVLAGTIRREHGGDTPDAQGDDADLLRAAQLARSSKDLEEHEFAVRSVAAALEPFCSSMNVPEAPFVLHLPNVMHLATDVTGVLTDQGATSGRRPPSSLSLAAALHPSAAVCGTPTQAARGLIREIEGLDRARYAGPVGWVGADGDGEWGIALRSAEISAKNPRHIRLFAGCGIVAASDPAAELAESEAKLEPMRYALATR
ncbi:isochorismate synthase MenF [Promicromonospora thailandica]|uniref:isochorismate synthase n=1 Tax=Promicromonospora thailandica TaxID=765201 RepID=A0A9X2G0E3_9MICO|nr:isochorismate synthase [Promicromonospora thailandica]MCP2263705.1 isochorismate synthase [Promicromonospora thailandica]BFF19087.1 chorismate-binding protein [Promicromonospora thailandica]